LDQCVFCNPKNFESWGRKLNLEDDFWYLVVPREIGTFGQVLLVTKRLASDEIHVSDITDPKLVSNPERLKSILYGLHSVAKKIKEGIIDEKGREVEKVYVLTQCEDENSHLHFSFYPRYQGDSTGNEFLYQCEWEEARMQEPPKIPPRMKLNQGMMILDHQQNLLSQDKWKFSDKEKKKKIKINVESLNQALS
jgi:diadenosine tetraphosphate (Ap4A) HIT family hydrolase